MILSIYSTAQHSTVQYSYGILCYAVLCCITNNDGTCPPPEEKESLHFQYLFESFAFMNFYTVSYLVTKLFMKKLNRDC